MEDIIKKKDFKSILPLIKRRLEHLFTNSDENGISDKQIEILKKYDSDKIDMVFQKINELNRPTFKMIFVMNTHSS